MNPVFIVDAGNGDDFAVGGAETLCPTVGGQQQFIAGSDFNRFAFVYIKTLCLYTKPG